MMRKVYVKSVCKLDSSQDDPDFREVLTPMEARRLGPLQKRAVWTSINALSKAGVTMPNAVITATDFGCMSYSESFLKALHGM